MLTWPEVPASDASEERFPELLDALEGWFQGEIRTLEDESVASDFGRTAAAERMEVAWVSIDRDGRVGELYVRATGNVDLVVGRDAARRPAERPGIFGDVEVLEEHEVRSVDELRTLYDRLLTLLGLGQTDTSGGTGG